MVQVDNQSVASAGQYFVCAELSRRGAIASLTLGNTPGVDVLATNKDGSKLAFIQVKTTRHRDFDWILGVKDERWSPQDINSFYVFVRYEGVDDLPEYYVAPAAEVSERIHREFKAWLKKPGRGGKPHDPKNTVRTWCDRPEYKDKWEMLGVF
jgi:hypothetical protein